MLQQNFGRLKKLLKNMTFFGIKSSSFNFMYECLMFSKLQRHDANILSEAKKCTQK